MPKYSTFNLTVSLDRTEYWTKEKQFRYLVAIWIDIEKLSYFRREGWAMKNDSNTTIMDEKGCSRDWMKLHKRWQGLDWLHSPLSIANPVNNWPGKNRENLTGKFQCIHHTAQHLLCPISIYFALWTSLLTVLRQLQKHSSENDFVQFFIWKSRKNWICSDPSFSWLRSFPKSSRSCHSRSNLQF